MLDNQFENLPETRQELVQLHDGIVLKLSLLQMQDDEIQQVIAEMDTSQADAAYARYKAKSGDRIKQLIPKWMQQEAPPRHGNCELSLFSG